MRTRILFICVCILGMSEPGRAELPVSADQWNLVNTFGGSVFSTPAGGITDIALPAQTVFDPLLGYVFQAPRVSDFILRVGPGSVQRGCALRQRVRFLQAW